MHTTDKNFEPELKMDTIQDLIVSELFIIFQKRDFAPIVPENLDDLVSKIGVLEYPVVKKSIENQNLNCSVILSELLDRLKNEKIIVFGKKHKESVYNDPQTKDGLSGCEIIWSRTATCTSMDTVKPISTEYGWGSGY